jgi:hypothetical protein
MPDVGMTISMVGCVLMFLPPVVNGALFLLHAAFDIAAGACHAVYPHP